MCALGSCHTQSEKKTTVLKNIFCEKRIYRMPTFHVGLCSSRYSSRKYPRGPRRVFSLRFFRHSTDGSREMRGEGARVCTHDVMFTLYLFIWHICCESLKYVLSVCYKKLNFWTKAEQVKLTHFGLTSSSVSDTKTGAASTSISFVTEVGVHQTIIIRVICTQSFSSQF